MARWRCSGVSACRKAERGVGDRPRARRAARPAMRQPVRSMPSVVTPRNGRSSSAARSSTMLQISGAAPRRRGARADIDCSGRMPNARHASSALSSAVPIGVLTVSRESRPIGMRRSQLGEPGEHVVDEGAFVNTPECVSNRSPPHASRKTPPASRTIRLGPAKSQSDPNVRIAASSSPLGHPHGVEHEALAARRGRVAGTAE